MRSSIQPSPIAIVPAETGVCRESWWVGASRDEFAARAEREQERMRTSRFGGLLEAATSSLVAGRPKSLRV